MTRPFRLLALAAVAIGFVACDDDDATGPGAESSTVAVRAYVDANGTGSFDPEDVPLSGVNVTLESGEETLTETTDGEGLAVFEAVPPGSWRASLGGDAPAGAILAGASNPIVVAPSFGAELETEFRFVFTPGSISGVLFRDENANGVFDAGVDTPAPGIPVALFPGEVSTGDPLRETTTDAEGGFEFETLRPGTYTLVFTPFPTMELVGGNVQTVTVAPAAPAAASVAFTGNLLSPIADAQAAALAGEATVVAVKGVTTFQPGFSDELFIQDETAGILVFARDVAVRDSFDLQPGDTVIVVGETELRFGEPQITRVTTLLPQGSGPALTPLVTAAVEINEGQHLHELVTITGATVTNVKLLSFGNQFVTLTDPAGNAFGAFADSRTGVTASTWVVGGIFDVTGNLGFDSREAFPFRIEVRGPEDVQAGEQPLSIAEARSLALGDTVLVSGVVTFKEPWNSRVYFFQDETGGISTFDGARVLSETVQIGDRIRVRGVLGQFDGEIQLGSIFDGTIIGQPGEPTPIAVTGAQINAGERQGMLVRITGTVTAVTQVNSFGTHRVELTDSDGTTFYAYVDNRTGVAIGDWTVGQTYTLTGVLGFDDDDTPSARLEIRSPADIQ